MSPIDSRLLVFTRAPQPGLAKTRLIPALGREGAAALHARLIKHTLNTAHHAALPLELHGDPADDPFLCFCAERYRASLVPQCQGDLGERMQFALAQALQSSRSAILVGTDCPALMASHLRRAAAALQEGYDSVFVATEDGGYALVGVARCHPLLFSGIEWSTPAVMQETRARLRQLGWRWLELETLWDVDRPLDYERLMRSGLLQCPAVPSAAPVQSTRDGGGTPP